jgi:hypothetical protein
MRACSLESMQGLRGEARKRSGGEYPPRNRVPFGGRGIRNSWLQGRRPVPYLQLGMLFKEVGRKPRAYLMQLTIFLRSSGVAAASRHLWTAQLPKLTATQINISFN